jgi:hypothetical protein
MTTPCNPCDDPGGQGNALAAPRRNRYFYGKLLDVPHMQMEQDYGKLKRWLINRLSLGTGVLCGLEVSARDGKICVSRGVAIDSFGREIIVPATYCIDPWELPDDCGNPHKALDRGAPHLVRLAVCYRECLADNSPVQVSDCNSTAACEAGTTIESFQFQIVEGGPERPRSDLCDLMHLDAGETGEVRDIPGLIRQRLCEKLPHPCAGDKDCCVLLAVIELGRDGAIGKIEACAVRTTLYSNATLFEMILCLTARIEECCGGEPPPPPRTILQVAGVEILDVDGQTIAKFEQPDQVLSVPGKENPLSIQVSFTDDVDPATVVTGTYSPVVDPDSLSFFVWSSNEKFTHKYVPGKIDFPGPGLVRFQLAREDAKMDVLPKGDYELRLFGDALPAAKRPAIVSAVAPKTRLDGETESKFPSGNGIEGGTYACKFTVL